MPSATLVPVDHEPSFGGVSFVPVDHEPDFGGVSLVPVEHNPFSADDMVRQARTQLASQPERVPRYDTSQDAAAMQPETFANPYVRGLIDNAASLPRRALENSQHSLDSGTYDPSAPLEAATLPMGTGVVAGLPLRAGEVALGAGPIRAYHGSPHDFDRFDLSKIGTGEGAQAYGHGLYFADQEATAQAYRDQLQWKGANFNDPQTIAQNAIDRHGDRAAAADSLESAVESTKRFHRGNVPASQAEANKSTMDAVALLRGNGPITGKPPTPGKMYEVNINADPEHFLDWDKPLNKQAPQVQEALQRTMGKNWDEFKYADAGTAVKNGFIAPSPEATAANLGIPGIKYLDQGSRVAGDGSRNYVVFNHDLINIVRKYAAAGIALPPALAAEYEQMKASQPQPNYTAGLTH